MSATMLRHVVSQQIRATAFRTSPRCTYASLKRSPASAARAPRLIQHLATRPLSKIYAAVESGFACKELGEPETLDYRLFITDASGRRVSPWHDIPLFSENSGLLNFVCEIPKDSAAKMEVAIDEENTPIKQDTKNGKLRYYPYNINWNYGLLPQTWEDPDVKNAELDHVAGDNDPVDVVEIGSATLEMGQVYRVKPLGVYAMIDDGELDWKVIAVREDDPRAGLVNDVEDVEREFPGELEKIMIWFRDYKTPDGKPQNGYGYGARCMNKEFCLEVIKETNQFWKALKSGVRSNTEELSLV